VPVGRAGEGPDWRGFCAAVTPRISASSPELAGGGWRQPAILILRGMHTGAVAAAGACHHKKGCFLFRRPLGAGGRKFAIRDISDTFPPGLREGLRQVGVIVRCCNNV
jgi:hypothetical protein